VRRSTLLRKMLNVEHGTLNVERYAISQELIHEISIQST
jgi:hypothetical protein